VSNDTKLLVRIPEAARRLSVSKSSVVAAIDRGELPVVRLSDGGHRRVPVSALENFVRERQDREGA
jgi:excisionase family DNA binding protein